MALDMHELDPEVLKKFEAMSSAQRTSFCCVVAERLLPLYKSFRDGLDWEAVEPCIAAGWKHVQGKAPKLGKTLWERTGELITHYYTEGEPLLLYGVCTSTNVLRSIKDGSSSFSAEEAAKAANVVLRAAREVDAVLAQHGSKAAGSALIEETAWLAATLAEVAKAPLHPSGVTLEPPKGLPTWFAPLRACKEPVRRVKLS